MGSIIRSERPHLRGMRSQHLAKKRLFVRKAVLLAYYFPPRMAAGSPRAAYLAKYLPKFDWQVTVVTARFLMGEPPSWATVVETGYTDVVERVKQIVGISKKMSAHAFLGSTSPKVGSKMTMKQRIVEASFKLISFPDPQIGWLKHGVRAVRTLLNTEGCDALISTSFPYTAHLIAKRALTGRKTPWIADLRDPWRGNPLITGMQSPLQTMLERKTLARANAITTVSAPLAAQIGKNHPTIPTFEVRNAFDPDDWIGVPFERPHRFTVTYAGSLYQGLRDPAPLFDALMAEFETGFIPRESVELIFYAQKEDWLERAIAERGLTDVVTIKGYVKRDEVFRAERATSANLLLLRALPGESGVYTGKLFEYLGAGRPILTIGGPHESVVRDLLARVGGWYATNPAEIRMALRTLYQMHETGSELRLSSKTSEDFSAITMAQRYASLLESVRQK